MALQAYTETLLNQRRDDIEGGLVDDNSISGASTTELFKIESLLGNIPSISLTGGVTVDNSGVENRLGATTDPVVAAGAAGSLNSLLKRSTIDLSAVLAATGQVRDEQVIPLPVQYGAGADTDPVGIGVYLYNRNTSASTRLAVVDAAGAIVAAPTNVRGFTGSSPTPATSSPSLTPYQIDGTGTVLYGIVDPDAATIDPIGPATAVAIGTGAGEAQIVPGVDAEVNREYTATAPDRAPDYTAGETLLRIIERPLGGGYSVVWLNADTGATFTTAPVNPRSFDPSVESIPPERVLYDLVNGTKQVGWYRRSTAELFSDFAAQTLVTIGANPTDADQSTIRLYQAELISTQVGVAAYAGAVLPSFTQPAAGANVAVLATLTTDAASGAELEPNGSEVFVGNGGNQVGGVYLTVGASTTESYTVTADAGTDVFTTNTAHIIPVDHPVALFINSSGENDALPAPLERGTVYYARTITATTFQLSDTPGGAAIDITDTGTGTFGLSVINLTLQRQDVALTLGQGVAQYSDGATVPALSTLSCRTPLVVPSNAESVRIETRLTHQAIGLAVQFPGSEVGQEAGTAYNARAAAIFPGNSDLLADSNNGGTYTSDVGGNFIGGSRIYRGQSVMQSIRMLGLNSRAELTTTFNAYFYIGEPEL